MHAISLLANHSNDRIPGIYRNRRRAMQDPKNDPNSETISPPTDRDVSLREEPTNPLAATVHATMVPPAGDPLAALEPSPDVERRPAGASLPPSEFFERSYHQMVKVHAKQVELHDAQMQRDKDLFDADGKFASVISGVMDRRLAAFEQKLDNRFTGIELKISKQADNIHALELRIQTMEGALVTLRAEVDKLKEQRGAAGPEAATAG